MNKEKIMDSLESELFLLDKKVNWKIAESMEIAKSMNYILNNWEVLK